MIDPDNPMVEILEPDKRGLVYECPSCGFVTVVPLPGFLEGHDVCMHKDGSFHRLLFLEDYLPPTKVWEGDYA